MSQVFDTVVTFVASWQKIFSHDSALGYWQQWRDARAKLASLTEGARLAGERLGA